MLACALTIAGSDPSGGAGIQADLKTFHQFGVYGEAAITLITVQNTTGVRRVVNLPPHLVRQQIEAVVEDIPPNACKIGALGTREIVLAVADAAKHFRLPLVVDPVMISKHGASLISPDARDAIISDLLPRTYLLTPNLPEAAELAGFPVEDLEGMRRAALRLCELGAQCVLIKGGHLEGDAVDLLYAGGQFLEYSSPRIATKNTHGTGCTYSAAITALLAKGLLLEEAVRRAKAFITEAIRQNPGLGQGTGPVNHFVTDGLA